MTSPPPQQPPSAAAPAEDYGSMDPFREIKKYSKYTQVGKQKQQMMSPMESCVLKTAIAGGLGSASRSPAFRTLHSLFSFVPFRCRA
jgi:hypothetical protein